MGNCIGKKSAAYDKQRRHSSATLGTSAKLYCNDQRPTKQVPSLVLASPSILNTSSERKTIFRSHLSDVQQANVTCNDNDESKRKSIIQYSTPSLLATMTPSTNESYVFMHTPSTLSPVQLSSECCKKIKSSNAMVVFGENHINQALTLTTTEQEMTVGHLFSKKKDLNKENDNKHDNTKLNIDIEIHRTDNEQHKSQDYFTIINEDKQLNTETMIDTQEIIAGELNYKKKYAKTRLNDHTFRNS